MNNTALAHPAGLGLGTKDSTPGERNSGRSRRARGTTVMVANPAGGSGKTTTALLLGAVLARRLGKRSVMWDNTESLGRIAHRLGGQPPQAGLRGLLSNWDGLLRTGSDADVARYLHSEPASCPVLPGEWARPASPLTFHDCSRLAAVLEGFHDTVIVDTGTDVHAAAWQWAARSADRLVVPVPVKPGAVDAVGWLFGQLDGIGQEALVGSAVCVLIPTITDTEPHLTWQIVHQLRKRTATVLAVPFERRLADGQPAKLSELSAATRRAWATVATELCEDAG
jgi:cellulose biosynthesis protein BcsQ